VASRSKQQEVATQPELETSVDEACSTVEILVESTAVQICNGLERDVKILSSGS